MVKYILLATLILTAFTLHAQQVVNPPTPDTLTKQVAVVNTQTISDIDIPIRIGLKPIYEWADRFVDTLYTSPNYPNDWLFDGCDTRYQYRFIRGPFRFKAFNNVLYISFSGFYGVRGSTRLCSVVATSPWTPACTCGFGTEKPRRIDAGFAISFRLQPDYTLGLTVKTIEPVPVDKCEVCFFGKDITKTVAAQLKDELTVSINDMQKQLETFSLKSYIQAVWDTLQSPYPIPGFGYLSVKPEQLRISQASLLRDSLFISLGLTARPELKSIAEPGHAALPQLSDFSPRSGIKIFVAQELPYDSLGGVANSKVAGQEFSVGKGMFKQTVRIDSMKLQGGISGILVKVYASKAARGVFYLQGIPKWNPVKQELWLDSLDYHFETKQWLLRTASNLLDGTITSRLETYMHFSLQEKIKELIAGLKDQMNKEIYPGVQSKGYLKTLTLNEVEASEKGIYIAAAAEGKLWMDVDAGVLIKKFTQ